MYVDEAMEVAHNVARYDWNVRGSACQTLAAEVEQLREAYLREAKLKDLYATEVDRTREALKPVTERACTLSMVDCKVSIDCDSQTDADRLFDWLESLPPAQSAQDCANPATEKT